MKGETVGDYRLIRKIGSGGFGEIYSAERRHSRHRFAVKIERLTCSAPQLAYESRLYSFFSGGVGVPKIHWSGRTELHTAMAIDLLGKSIEDLFISCGRLFSLKTVLMLADQMLSCIEFIHSKNFVHRDIKPQNFVIGRGRASNQVFMIDYGLARGYRDQNTHAHIPYGEGRSLTGTAEYASFAALRGVEVSRRDDLESLGYLLVRLLRGGLPWERSAERNRPRGKGRRYSDICAVMAKMSFSELCEGMPGEFVRYFEMVRKLKFAEEPDYAGLRRMFRELFIRRGFVYDGEYDWCTEGREVKVKVKVEEKVEERIASARLAKESVDRLVGVGLVRTAAIAIDW